MASPNWMSDNLSSMLLGKAKETKKETPKETKTPISIQPTKLSPSSNDIVKPIHPKIPSPNRRVNFPVYLPQDLHQRFSAAVQADGRKKSSLIVSWIIEYLKQREQYEN